MPTNIATEHLGVVLTFLDLFGIAVFAVTGAVAAARREQTFVTLTFFALITGVGGGTTRDLLIGAPVFWVHDPYLAGLCLGIALAVWFTPQRWWNGSLFDWLDAAGLAAYAAFGAAKALSYGIPPLPAIMMGTLTACAGGIIRDLLAGEPSILMRPELYVTAAALAAALQVGLTLMGIQPFMAGLISTSAGFALRGAAIYWKIGLPAYSGPRARP